MTLHTEMAQQTERFYLVNGVVQQREEGNDWERWKIRMYNQMARQFTHPGLAPLEQYMIRSQREKRCIDCGDPCSPDRFMDSVLVKSVKGYYHCAECEALYD